MDQPSGKMDVSTRIDIGPAPLSFWVRMAHQVRYGPADQTPRANLRVIADFEVVLQLEGSSWIWSGPDGGSADVPAGAVAFIPPGFVHAWGRELGVHMAVHFDLDPKPTLQATDNIRLLGPTVERRPAEVVRGFTLQAGLDEPPLAIRLVTEVTAPKLWEDRLGALVELGSRRATGTLEGRLRSAEILGFALRELAAGSEGRPLPTGRAARVNRLLGTLDSPARRARVGDLAALAQMSETSLRAAFQEAVGCAPRRYLEDRRIEHATRALIETDQTVAQIAEAAGYSDPYHFSRVFRRVTGVSPRRYRQNARDRLQPVPGAPP